MNKLFLFSALLLFAVSNLQAQGVIKGKIIDISTEQPIGLATIKNLKFNISTFSDSSGLFSIRATFGDSLVIHALSYTNDTIVVSKDKYLILLQSTSNLLEEVNIRPLNLQPLSLPISPFHGQSMVYKYHYGGDEIGGAVFRVWYWKKDEKKRSKRLLLEEDYKKSVEIREIFSEDNLSNYLPLRGEELRCFIKLCTPTPREFSASDFHFLTYISNCYKKFINTKANTP